MTPNSNQLRQKSESDFWQNKTLWLHFDSTIWSMITSGAHSLAHSRLNMQRKESAHKRKKDNFLKFCN